MGRHKQKEVCEKKAQGESEKKREREMKPNYIDAIFILTAESG